MPTDTKGNDITYVDIPVDGQLWIGPSTVPVMAKTDLMLPTLVVPNTLTPLGLLTTDGGPEWGTDGVGDATEFFQEGYSLPGMGGYYTLQVTAAQNQPFVNQLLNGVAFDQDGYREVDQISNANVYTVLSQVIYKSGRIRRNMSNNVMVSEGSRAKEERPNVTGTELTFKWQPMSNGVYFNEALISPASA